MSGRTALLVSAFDSQLKWALRVGSALAVHGFECRVVKPTDIRNSISDMQLADHGATQVDELTWNELLDAGVQADVVVLVVQGSFVARFCHDLHERSQAEGLLGPLVVTGWVGVVLREITAGYLDRCIADVLAVNSRSDLQTFRTVADSVGIPTDNLVLSGLPLLGSGIQEPRTDRPISMVMYADQPTMPSRRNDRVYVYDRLVQYARAHPERRVILKPRHRPNEGTIHHMKYPPELLLRGMDLPPNFEVDYTPISERLPELDLMLTISSTAALEAVAAGVRTAFISDLGVREGLGNHIFLGSRLLRTFDEIEKDDIGTPDPRWIGDYFFPLEHGSPAGQLAARVFELMEGQAPRPSQTIRTSAFYLSQRELFQHHKMIHEPAPSPIAEPARGPRRRSAPDLAGPDATTGGTAPGLPAAPTEDVARATQARRLTGRSVRRLRARVGRTIRRWTGAGTAEAGQTVRKESKRSQGRYDDYRMTLEIATNPLFGDSPIPVPTPALAARLKAQGAGEHPRFHKLEAVPVTLRTPEVESIRRHGIVRLERARIAGVSPPPAGVAFATVTNDKYAPGVEALVLSLLKLYPGFGSDVVVFHDDSLSEFSQKRLSSIYPQFRFLARSPEIYDVGQLAESVNHRRVGLLDYLSLEVLLLEGYDRVVLVDADTIVLNDLSRLWADDNAHVVADHGVLPFGLITEATGRPVINSGMISLPARELGPDRYREAMDLLPATVGAVDPLIDNFADQKLWNLYLAKREVTFLPVNYNADKTYVDKYHPDAVADVALLHMTGPKPWYDFGDRALTSQDDLDRLRRARVDFPATFALWDATYGSAISTRRIQSFRADCGPDLERLGGSKAGRPAAIIGNGPSLNVTDLTAFEGFETYVFNWFVNHEDFDEIRPDHLILVSHLFFGGWHTARPAIPHEFLTALGRRSHKPRIWTSYCFRDLVRATPELEDYPISYVLFEKPLKEPVTRRGAVGLDLYSPLVDANTGVLTAGIPTAVHLGATELVLAGCDSDYSSGAGSYFYEAAGHSSRTTADWKLLQTWDPRGAGQFGYRRAMEVLSERGIRLRNATIGGRLDVLERISLDDVRGLAAGGDTGHGRIEVDTV